MVFTVEQFEFYLCILARMTAFIYTAPFFSLKNVPQNVKILFSMILSLIMFEILPYVPLDYISSVGFFTLITTEVLAGAILGLFGNISYYILSFAGHMMDVEIGFAMVTEFDPLTSNQVTITSNLYTYAVTLVLLVTNMHHHIILALTQSFELIPVGKVVLNPGIYQVMVDFIVDYFIIGFRIVLPMFATILIVNVVLGILAKVAAQMNMFVIGMQLKVFIGLSVLVFIIGMLPMVADFIFDEMINMIRKAIQFLR